MSERSQLPSNGIPILKMVAEGGGETLYGRQTAVDWEFSTSLVDQTPWMLDEPAIHRESGWTRDWNEALARLDRYPWHHFHPITVLPEFRARVWEAFSARLAGARSPPRESTLAHWRERCGIAP
jgi:hypothetical protein